MNLSIFWCIFVLMHWLGKCFVHFFIATALFCCFFTIPFSISQWNSYSDSFAQYIFLGHTFASSRILMRAINLQGPDTWKSWPYPSSFAHENLVWLWVALCFKKTYYRNRWCPLFHNKDAMILLVLSVGVSNGCWFTSSRNVCVMHLPSFFKLSSAFLRLVLFFFNLEYF
jgi:hypothetical protein